MPLVISLFTSGTRESCHCVCVYSEEMKVLKALCNLKGCSSQMVVLDMHVKCMVAQQNSLKLFWEERFR